MPSMCAPAKTVISPAITHTMFAACAPPARMTFLFAAMLTEPVEWKIHLSLLPPLIVTSSEMSTLDVHL
eukprot:7079744-Heterocapsa_arctica.AAC.1